MTDRSVYVIDGKILDEKGYEDFKAQLIKDVREIEDELTLKDEFFIMSPEWSEKINLMIITRKIDDLPF